MKKIIIIILCAVAFIAATSVQQPTGKDIARVNRVQGYYIFIQCAPTADYDVLGTVKKTGIVLSGSPEEMYNTLLRRAKKDYPKCDGIIFEDVAMEHATCILFK